ncbi:MAG: DUF5915 domain-containing protein, partial [bacterium]|nr:DUF5915 domain-containing protein [bacterium]
FAPFHAEHVWQTLGLPGSVHLASWDIGGAPATAHDAVSLADMETVRRFCSLGLEARAAVNIPIRQPLAKLAVHVGERALSTALLALIAEEVNVKEVVCDPKLTEEVRLDTELTPELQREGMVRELTRAVNNLRKEMGLAPTDRIAVTYHTDDTALAAAITEHREQLERATAASAWVAGTPTEPTELSIGGATIALRIAR